MKASNKQGYMRRNKKRDANEPEIIAILEFVFCTVYSLDKPLDLLVGYRGRTFILEVKNPEGKNRIEKDQQEFFDEWTGGAALIVRTQFDALRAIGFTEDGAKIVIKEYKKTIFKK